MSNISLVSIIIGLAVGVIATSGILLPALKKKGVNTGTILDQTSNAISVLTGTFEALKTLLPNTPAVALVDKILKWATVGVNQAEQLYIIGKISGDERKAAAIDYIHESLKLAGVEITPSIDKIIDGAIEAAVLALGHGN